LVFIISSLPSTISSKVFLHIIIQTGYLGLAACRTNAEFCFWVFEDKVCELITQTLAINQKWGTKYLGTNVIVSRKREALFVGLLGNVFLAVLLIEISGILFVIYDVPLSIYGFSEQLRGRYSLLFVYIVIRVLICVEETWTVFVTIISVTPLFSSIFWARKAW
jgi:hypothetical protein